MRSRAVRKEPESIDVEAMLLKVANDYLKAMGWEECVSYVDNMQLIPGKGAFELVVRFKGGKP